MSGQDARVNDADMGYMSLYRSKSPYKAGQITVPPSTQAPSSGSRWNHALIIGPGVGVDEVSRSSGPCAVAAIDATSPKVASLRAVWPEWRRANDTDDVAAFGGVAACCNDTTVANETNVTAFGGGGSSPVSGVERSGEVDGLLVMSCMFMHVSCSSGRHAQVFDLY
jgi:hypothetical protein